MYTRRKFGYRAGSVERALGVQSCENWQVITGSVSAEPEPTSPMGDSETVFFFFFSPLLFLKYHSSPQKARQAWGNSRASLFP